MSLRIEMPFVVAASVFHCPPHPLSDFFLLVLHFVMEMQFSLLMFRATNLWKQVL